MKKRAVSYRSNLIVARHLWGPLSRVTALTLREYTEKFSFSVAAGDLQLLNGRWYVTHSGLLSLASRRACRGIETAIQGRSSDAAAGRWVFKAIVYKSVTTKRFVGYGDADPSNVFGLVRGAEMRIAETRAVNRALRKAYGIGLCSVEELGALNSSSSPARSHQPPGSSPPQNDSGNGQPRLKDKLCLLIRQYNLNPTLVKAYAADFCGTEKLSSASREMVERFISQLEKSAKENRDSLVCKLNSYAQPQQVLS